MLSHSMDGSRGLILVTPTPPYFFVANPRLAFRLLVPRFPPRLVLSAPLRCLLGPYRPILFLTIESAVISLEYLWYSFIH